MRTSLIICFYQHYFKFLILIPVILSEKKLQASKMLRLCQHHEGNMNPARIKNHFLFVQFIQSSSKILKETNQNKIKQQIFIHNFLIIIFFSSTLKLFGKHKPFQTIKFRKKSLHILSKASQNPYFFFSIYKHKKDSFDQCESNYLSVDIKIQLSLKRKRIFYFLLQSSYDITAINLLHYIFIYSLETYQFLQGIPLLQGRGRTPNFSFALLTSYIYLLTQMNIPYCPILKPTSKEFKNFYQYVEFVDKNYRKDYGMVKIIPPHDWKARESDYGASIDNFMIPGPIQQNTYGKGGVYECLHIQKKSLSYKQYKKKTMPFDKIAQGKAAQDVEDLFWKNIAFSPPLYGADIQVSFMQPCAGSWNLSGLNSVLNNALKSNIKGVNTPYCYIGSWKTLFAWHTEDLQLAAINYVHIGKPKFWYSIPQNQHHIIENQAKKLFGEHFSKCSEYLRHKTTVINPYYLKQKYPELKISKAQHKAGQFILVFGGAYHCGFNFGFNLAEAINYATLSWLRQFATAKTCKCHNDSVKINHVQALKSLENSIFKDTKQVQQFRQLIGQQLQEADSNDSSTMIEREAIKKVFKKISKRKKQAKKIMFKGEKYQIDNWYQCDKCNRWRRSPKTLPNNSHFYCEMVNTSCKRKQQDDKEFITM